MRTLPHAFSVLATLPLGFLLLAASPLPAGLNRELAYGRLITGATHQRVLHLTFDDGPDPRTTPRLLDMLDELGIKATFFFSASRFRGREKRNAAAADIARETLRRGHAIGSHSVDHVRMGRMSPAELAAQLNENDQLFEAVFGQRTFLFRPPFGSHNRQLDRMLHSRGYTHVLWNIGLADWVQRSPESILKTFIKMLKRNETRKEQLGGVVLLHDTHAWTVDAVPLIVTYIRQRNCELLQAGEHLYDFSPSLKPFYQASGNASAGIEADPIAKATPTYLAKQPELKRWARQWCKQASTVNHDRVQMP